MTDQPPGSAGDFDALLKRFEPQVQRSVDPFEVAVMLEAEGIDDAEAERYGASDVFELARRLRDAAAPDVRGPAPPRKDWYPSAPIAVLRGLTFTMGALTIMTAVGLGAGSQAVVLVIVVNTMGVAVMQAVSFLSYVSLERSGKVRDPSAIRPLLLVLVLPLLVAVVGATLVDPLTGLFAGAALAYLTGMVMVLVLGRPVLVAVIVLPVAALAIVDSLEPDRINATWVVGAWLFGALLLVTASFVLTRPEGRRVVVRLGAVDLRAALPFAAAGLATGIVVIANLVTIASSPPLQAGGTRSWLIAALPFLIPVSLAELLVVGVRRLLHQATASTSSPEEFRRLGHRDCRRMWLVHVTVGAAVLALVVPLLEQGDLMTRVLLGLSFLLIGTLLTASLLLLSGDALRLEVGLLAVTAASLMAAWLTQTVLHSTHQLAVDVVILAIAAAVGVTLSTRVTGSFAHYR